MNRCAVCSGAVLAALAVGCHLFRVQQDAANDRSEGARPDVILFEALKSGEPASAFDLLLDERCLLSQAERILAIRRLWEIQSLNLPAYPVVPGHLWWDLRATDFREYSGPHARGTGRAIRSMFERELLVMRSEAEREGFSWEGARLDRSIFWKQQRGLPYQKTMADGYVYLYMSDGQQEFALATWMYPAGRADGSLYMVRQFSEEETILLCRLRSWATGGQVSGPWLGDALRTVVRQRLWKKEVLVLLGPSELLRPMRTDDSDGGYERLFAAIGTGRPGALLMARASEFWDGPEVVCEKGPKYAQEEWVIQREGTQDTIRVHFDKNGLVRTAVTHDGKVITGEETRAQK